MKEYKKQIRRNQKGASAIMFALFFIMVISLISLGFATLSRRDQRATLDKTLSAQAQLAAESGINAVKQYFETTPAVPGPVLEKTDCAESGVLAYPKFSNGTTITCLTWDATPTEAVKVLDPYKGWSFTNTSSSGTDRITWETQENAGVYGGNAGPRAALPPLSTANIPILKLVSVPVNDITNTGSPKVEITYLVPGVNNGAIPSTVALGDAGTNTNGNGSVYNVNCSGNRCSANLSGYATPSSGTARMYYIQLIGSKTATITYASLSGGNLQQLTGMQAKVDVNVITQDQSKRLVSYVPIASTTTNWQPFFSALADSLCKDIKIDSANVSSVSGSPVCPN